MAGAVTALTRSLSANGNGVQASQATHVEQSRAIAEVRAMVLVAQEKPRSEAAALNAILESCKLKALADRAFFKYSRGGENVTGATIQLAVQMARCWGNINFGVKELARNDDTHESEMIAFAWDVETNTRSEASFIVPHKRDTKKGAVLLDDMRSIYENNANNAARRLREMIFRVIPPYVRIAAEDECMSTLRNGGGVPLPRRIADCIHYFGQLGISRERMEAKVGMSMDAVTEVDLAGLEISYRSIKNGEIDKDEEFPPVTAANLNAALREPQPPQPNAPAAQSPPAGAGSEAEPPAQEPSSRSPSPTPEPKPAPAAEYNPRVPVEALESGMEGCTAPDEVESYWRDIEEARGDLNATDRQRLATRKAEILRDMTSKAKGRR